MSHLASSAPKKRTNVRTVSLELRATAAGLRALEVVSASSAAQLGLDLMFRTTRGAPGENERAILAKGRRFSVLSHGRRLAAWSFGEGPIVLLVHGWNGRGGQLANMVEPLLARGFRVVTFDGPGHGESEGQRSSLPELADAIDDVLTSIATPFVPLQAVIAHSMGGASVAFAMARQLREPTPSNERALRDELPVRRFVFVAPPVDIRSFLDGFCRAVGLRDETRREMERLLEQRFGRPLDAYYAPNLVAGMTAPLLVVHDENDREVPVAAGRLLAGAWSGAELFVTQGLGHTRILRDVAAVERVVAFATS